MRGKKPSLMILMGKGKPPGSPAPGDDDDAEEDKGEEVPEEAISAAEEFADAIQSGDGAAIYRKFKAMKEICDSYGDES